MSIIYSKVESEVQERGMWFQDTAVCYISPTIGMKDPGAQPLSSQGSCSLRQAHVDVWNARGGNDDPKKVEIVNVFKVERLNAFGLCKTKMKLNGWICDVTLVVLCVHRFSYESD